MKRLTMAALAVLSLLFVATLAGESLGQSVSHSDQFAAKPCSLLSAKTASAVLQQPMAVAPAETAHLPGQCEWTTGGKSLVELARTPKALTLSIDIMQKD